MGKTKLFIKLYYRHKLMFFIRIIIFLFAGVVISCSLFVRDNNKKFYNAQLEILENSEMPEEDKEEIRIMKEEAEREESSFFIDSVGDILAVFALISILIGISGCTSLLFFQDISMQKTFAMLRISGIQKRDLFYRALTDGICYGFLSGAAGCLGGFLLFRHLAVKLCRIHTYFSVLSIESLKTLFLVVLILFIIAFFGSFVSGLYLYEKPVVLMLYGRESKKVKLSFWKAALFGAALIYVLVCTVFKNSLLYINILLAAVFIVIMLLAAVFYFVFKIYAGRRHKKENPIKSIYSISRCFLCTRKKRDAFLAAMVSAGAIIVCFILNIQFNFSGILRDSYRDRQGYSTVVSLQGFEKLEEIEKFLDDNGYKYTLLYQKWIGYSELNGVPVDEEKDKYNGFWPAVLSKQTDININFYIQEGTFMAENYFIYRCNLEEGKEYDTFGGNVLYTGAIDGSRQYMGLVRYNCIINEKDWHLGIDDTWNILFLLDLSKAEETKLEGLLSGMQCRVETASKLIDALNQVMADYISVIAVIGIMLILVTAAFFYSMVQGDLAARKKELYLYQIYGASRKKAFWVVYLEYLIIAWIASFSVVCVTMMIGSCFFRFFLDRHYPLSVPVVLITSLISSVFVLLCCFWAQWVNFWGSKIEIIRDE